MNDKAIFNRCQLAQEALTEALEAINKGNRELAWIVSRRRQVTPLTPTNFVWICRHNLKTLKLMNNHKLIKLCAIEASVRELFPGDGYLSLVFSGGTIDVNTFEHATYKAATEWFREWGVGQRIKNPQSGYTAIEGRAAENVTLKAFVNDLPPTCHKVKYIERVPKTQTVETGEYVEIEREKIVCPNAEPQEDGPSDLERIQMSGKPQHQKA